MAQIDNTSTTLSLNEGQTVRIDGNVTVSGIDIAKPTIGAGSQLRT